MKLILQSQQKQLFKNGLVPLRGQDHYPVVKLFTPWAGATWLLTETDLETPDLAFGLCDLGLGVAELGYVSLEELQSLKGPFGLRIERDMHFTAKHPLSVYTEAARLKGGITESPDTLEQVAYTLKNRQS